MPACLRSTVGWVLLITVTKCVCVCVCVPHLIPMAIFCVCVCVVGWLHLTQVDILGSHEHELLQGVFPGLLYSAELNTGVGEGTSTCCVALNPLSRTAFALSLPTDRKTSRTALLFLRSFLSPLFLLCSCLRFSSCVCLMSTTSHMFDTCRHLPKILPTPADTCHGRC